MACEADLKKALGFDYQNVRIIQQDQYAIFKSAGIGMGLINAGFNATADQEASIKKYYQTSADASGKGKGRGHGATFRRHLRRHVEGRNRLGGRAG